MQLVHSEAWHFLLGILIITAVIVDSAPSTLKEANADKLEIEKKIQDSKLILRRKRNVQKPLSSPTVPQQNYYDGISDGSYLYNPLPEAQPSNYDSGTVPNEGDFDSFYSARNFDGNGNFYDGGEEYWDEGL